MDFLKSGTTRIIDVPGDRCARNGAKYRCPSLFRCQVWEGEGMQLPLLWINDKSTRKRVLKKTVKVAIRESRNATKIIKASSKRYLWLNGSRLSFYFLTDAASLWICQQHSSRGQYCNIFSIPNIFKGTGQCDGPKNYEYFGGLVKKKITYLIDKRFRGLF